VTIRTATAQAVVACQRNTSPTRPLKAATATRSKVKASHRGERLRMQTRTRAATPIRVSNRESSAWSLASSSARLDVQTQGGLVGGFAQSAVRLGLNMKQAAGAIRAEKLAGAVTTAPVPLTTAPFLATSSPWATAAARSMWSRSSGAALIGVAKTQAAPRQA